MMSDALDKRKMFNFDILILLGIKNKNRNFFCFIIY